MNPRDFFRDLLHRSIHSGILAMFWKMPLIWTILIVALLIGIVVWFGLY